MLGLVGKLQQETLRKPYYRLVLSDTSNFRYSIVITHCINCKTKRLHVEWLGTKVTVVFFKCTPSVQDVRNISKSVINSGNRNKIEYQSN